MDCFDHERMDVYNLTIDADSTHQKNGWQFGHGHGHGMNYGIPWDGYGFLW